MVVGGGGEGGEGVGFYAPAVSGFPARVPLGVSNRTFIYVCIDTALIKYTPCAP